MIASGGVGTLDDLEALAALEVDGRRLVGAIVGKAHLRGPRSTWPTPGRGGRPLGSSPMRTARVIPCLDVDAGRVVKGVNFVGLRDAGDPVELAARYDAEGADELVFLDITASSDGREHDGRRGPPHRRAGVHPVHGRRRHPHRSTTPAALLRAGADKVSVNTAAVERPELITEIAAEFGAQCVVCAIDARGRRDGTGGWEVYIHGGRTPTGIDAVAWVEEVGPAGRGGDPAHVDGPRRHPGRLRPRAHARRSPTPSTCR